MQKLLKKRILPIFFALLMISTGVAGSVYAGDGTGINSTETGEEAVSVSTSAIQETSDEKPEEADDTSQADSEEERDADPILYSISIDETIKNGEVLVNESKDVQRYEEGTIVNISVLPDTGFILDELTVTDAAEAKYPLTEKEKDKYTLIMPASDVIVKAAFKEDAADSDKADEVVVSGKDEETGVSQEKAEAENTETTEKTEATESLKDGLALEQSEVIELFTMNTLELFMAQALQTISFTMEFVSYAAEGYGSGYDANFVMTGGNAPGFSYGYCIVPEVQAPSGGAYTTNISAYNNQAMLKVMVYGFGGAKDITAGYASSGPARHILTHMVATRVANEQGIASGNYAYKANATAIALADRLYTDIMSRPDVSGEVYVSTPVAGLQTMLFMGKYNTTAKLKLKKRSEMPEMTTGRNCYSLAGAVYTVYKDAACTNPAASMTTDQNGETAYIDLDAGIYYVKETTAPKGFYMNPTVYPVNLSAGQSYTIDAADVPMTDPIMIHITKISASEQYESTHSLEGTQFVIKYYDGYYDESNLPAVQTNTWVLVTKMSGSQAMAWLNEDHKIAGDGFYMYNGRPVLPLGTITIEETAPAPGYTLNGAYFTVNGSSEKITGRIVRHIVGDQSGVYISGGNEFTGVNYPGRGDFEFTKIAKDTKKGLSKVKFTITSNETGESKSFVTDSKGYYSSKSDVNPHASNNGLWFGDGDLDESVGALPFGKYTIKEERCKGNFGYDLQTFEIEITENGTVLDAGKIENSPIKIQTTATDVNTGSHVGVSGVTTIKDVVKYENLIPGKEYKLEGSLYIKETGEELGIKSSVTFTAEKSKGEVEMTFEVDASLLKGKTTVVFEDLYDNGVHIATHADIEDEDQSVHYPGIHTTATSNGKKIIKADGSVTITDTVAYENLIPGEEYTLSGIQMVREEGAKLLVDGKDVTGETTFTPEAANGTIDVVFTFNASELAGKTVVTFEKLIHNGVEVTTHEDIEDEGQSVHFPKIHTNATSNGQKRVRADGTVTITDTVTYENLIPGEEYTLIGVQMVREEGAKLLVDGKDVTGETTFTPEAANGTIDVVFTFNAKDIAGKTLVTFEKLIHDGVEITNHEDINDEGQSVEFYRIGKITTKGNPRTGDASPAALYIILLAAAAFTGVLCGKSYKKAKKN